MTQIHSLICRDDRNQTACVASLKGQYCKMLIHPIILIIINNTKITSCAICRSSKFFLCTMKLIDYFVLNIKMVMRLILYNSRKLDVICPELLQQCCRLIYIVTVRLADDEVHTEHAVLIFILCKAADILTDLMKGGFRNAAQ